MSPDVNSNAAKGTTMHMNAPLTAKGREVVVDRIASGQRVAEVAQAMGVSEIAARKWWRRHMAGEPL